MSQRPLLINNGKYTVKRTQEEREDISLIDIFELERRINSQIERNNNAYAHGMIEQTTNPRILKRIKISREEM